MTVKDIEAYLLNQLGTKVNIATIYRNLDKLEKSGCKCAVFHLWGSYDHRGNTTLSAGQ